MDRGVPSCPGDPSWDSWDIYQAIQQMELDDEYLRDLDSSDLAAGIKDSSDLAAGIKDSSDLAAGIKDFSDSAAGTSDLAAGIKDSSDLADSSINRRGKGLTMDDDDYVPVKYFNFTLPSSIITAPKEDDSWLDKEIEEEEDAHMKEIMIRVKRTMKRLDNETKRNYIFEERMRIVEREQYANDINSTQGFEVGEYPYLSRQLVGSFITRYYCPPDTTITDYELDKLTSFANLAIGRYNSTQNTEFGNVLVIKAMRSFSCGHWYYLTFQASLPDYHPMIFEAKLYDEPHWVSPPVTIQFVRLKMG